MRWCELYSLICFPLQFYIQACLLVRHIRLSQNVYRTVASRKHSSYFNQRWASEFWFLKPFHENNHLLHLRHCTVNYFVFVFSSGRVTSSSPLQRPTNILLYVTNLHRVRCGFLSCGDHRTHARANAKGCKSIEYCYRVLHVNT